MKSLFSSIWNSISHTTEDIPIEELKSNIFFQKLITSTLSLKKPALTKFLIEVLKEVCGDKQKKLRKLISIGIPNELCSLRALLWKIQLGYLSGKVISWETCLELKRQDYYKLKFEIITKLAKTLKQFQDKLISLNVIDFNSIEATSSFELFFEGGYFNNQMKEHEIIISKLSNIDFFRKILPEHKFRNYPDFKEFLNDYTIIDDINKDILRTRSINYFPSMKGSKISYDEEANKVHSDLLIRILFIYAKQNPSIGYIQGMNEIVAKVYHCFMSDSNFVFSGHLEADTYNSFVILMDKIKNIYLREKDFKISGIYYQLGKIKFILRSLDKEISTCFEKNNLELDLFCFRWYAVIFSQDIDPPDIFRLWDILLIEDDVYDFLNFICVAVLRIKKNEFIKLDIAGILENLKNLKKLNIDTLIKTSYEIKSEYRTKKVEKQFVMMK